ncbi:chaplin [Streptomyces sp. LX-29]|uniref:chaplin n=1 Tax=Streptomyces sp. LX-29 TaxID=2900152 RepID=UPI00240E6509|nr:chaplin [Streptomyces sp. LX-29]WFB09728.1 chaplin [Streptomyces sp. LX-29]
MKRISRVAVLTISASAVALGGAGTAVAGGGDDGGNAAIANGGAIGSPGVVSGNNIQVPVNIPINLCGNTIDLVGALNPAMGNFCANV